MKQFLFPAVFYKESEGYTVLFPDINITTSGETMEEAYLFAKDSLKIYCSYAEKFSLDLDIPSLYEEVLLNNEGRIVCLVDCFVMENESQEESLNEEDQDYEDDDFDGFED